MIKKFKKKDAKIDEKTWRRRIGRELSPMSYEKGEEKRENKSVTAQLIVLESHWADSGSLSRLCRMAVEIESRDQGDMREPWLYLRYVLIFTVHIFWCNRVFGVSGYYMGVESETNESVSTAELTSPRIQGQDVLRCFSFWYFIKSTPSEDNPPSLQLGIITPLISHPGYVLFAKQSDTNGSWIIGQVNIRINDEFHLSFLATVSGALGQIVIGKKKEEKRWKKIVTFSLRTKISSIVYQDFFQWKSKMRSIQFVLKRSSSKFFLFFEHGFYCSKGCLCVRTVTLHWRFLHEHNARFQKRVPKSAKPSNNSFLNKRVPFQHSTIFRPKKPTVTSKVHPHWTDKVPLTSLARPLLHVPRFHTPAAVSGAPTRLFAMPITKSATAIAIVLTARMKTLRVVDWQCRTRRSPPDWVPAKLPAFPWELFS